MESNYGYVYLQPKDCNQEITYSEWIPNGQYYKIGFDIAHSYNNSSHDENYVRQEAEKIKALVEAYTIEDARKEIEEYLGRERNKFKDYLIEFPNFPKFKKGDKYKHTNN